MVMQIIPTYRVSWTAAEGYDGKRKRTEVAYEGSLCGISSADLEAFVRILDANRHRIQRYVVEVETV